MKLWYFVFISKTSSGQTNCKNIARIYIYKRRDDIIAENDSPITRLQKESSLSEVCKMEKHHSLEKEVNPRTLPPPSSSAMMSSHRLYI